MSTKKFVYIPVGPIYRLSYQYHVKTVLENWTTYFDHVVVISNSRETVELPINRKNLTLISDSDSWFPQNENGDEVTDWDVISRNAQRVKDYSLVKEHDIYIVGDILFYISGDQYQRFDRYCDQLVSSNQLFYYRYRSFQVFDRLLVPSIRHPWIININHQDFQESKVFPDELRVDGRIYRAERGQFKDAPCHFYDMYPAILTKRDYHDKYEYYIKYLNEYYNNQGQGKDWLAFVAREYNKYKSIPPAECQKLDQWGLKMVSNIPEKTIYKYFNQLDSGVLGKSLWKINRLRNKLIGCL